VRRPELGQTILAFHLRLRTDGASARDFNRDLLNWRIHSVIQKYREGYERRAEQQQ
jgi:hypothetical protein